MSSLGRHMGMTDQGIGLEHANTALSSEQEDVRGKCLTTFNSRDKLLPQITKTETSYVFQKAVKL